MRRGSVANIEWQQVLNARRPKDERILDADLHGLWPATVCWGSTGRRWTHLLPKQPPITPTREHSLDTRGGLATPCDHGQLVVRQVMTSMR